MPAGAAPFDPGFSAGTLNNAAGRYSPFDMRITRGDGEQDMTRFSSVLPPGVVARLAGTAGARRRASPRPRAARARTAAPKSGATPAARPAPRSAPPPPAPASAPSSPTCPASSTSPAPTTARRSSVVAITPAVAGPFDAGTVVVREALRLNPVTGVAEVDGAASDPIPHILQGIPLNVRDLRVHVDKPDFTLNATSCAELQTKATLWGGGTVLAPTPDSPVDLAARYQAADCAGLGFKPRLAIRLYGGTRRGAHPALRAIVRPDPGEANFSRAAVTLPHSAFLDQAHIRTICTRVQFAAGAGHGSQCPKGAVYGSAKAWSPLLDGPATGPVYLQVLQPQPARPRRRAERPRLGPGRRRARLPHRLGQGRHPQHLHRHPRRPGQPLRAGDAGRQEGPDRQQQEPLLQAEAQQGAGQPAGPKRPQAADQAEGRLGQVREAAQGQAQAQEADPQAPRPRGARRHGR